MVILVLQRRVTDGSEPHAGTGIRAETTEVAGSEEEGTPLFLSNDHPNPITPLLHKIREGLEVFCGCEERLKVVDEHIGSGQFRLPDEAMGRDDCLQPAE